MKKVIITIMICLCFTGCSNPKNTYNNAVKAMKEEKWKEASDLFDSILEYEDSKELSKQCKKEKLKHEKADYEFLKDIEKAIMKRYEISKEEDSLEKCIGYDLEALCKYKEKEFYDQELKKLALEYIEGVEIQKASLSEVPGERQMKLYEGRVKRFKVLKKLTDQYGMLKDNIDYKVNYYNLVDESIKEYEAFKEIENSIKDLSKTLENVNYNTCRFSYTNPTDYNFDLYIYFTFEDEEGEVIANTEEYYEIEAKSKNKLDFYIPEETCFYDYYTEEYIYY